MIHIGLLAWNERSSLVKPVRGKRVCLRTSCEASYETIQNSAVKRMKIFYKDLIDEKTGLLPHIWKWRYCFLHSWITYYIDYKSITLYLLAENDKIVMDKIKNNQFSDDENLHLGCIQADLESPCKKIKSNSCKFNHQEAEDRIVAESLQALFDDMPIEISDEDLSPDLSNLPLTEIVSGAVLHNKY